MILLKSLKESSIVSNYTEQTPQVLPTLGLFGPWPGPLVDSVTAGPDDGIVIPRAMDN